MNAVKRFIRSWRIPLALWAVGVLLFLCASAFGYVRGGETIRTIATAFHGSRIDDMIASHNYRAAAKDYIAWRWLDPENDDLLLRLAEVHLLEREPHRAYYRLRPMAEGMSEDAYEVCRLMALIQSKRGDISGIDWARRTLNAAVTQEEKVAAQLVVAYANRMSDQSGEAKVVYRRVLELMPENPEARFYLASEEERSEILTSFSAKLKEARFDHTRFSVTPDFILRTVRAHP